MRQQLLEMARHDSRITAAAITGSLAADAEDRWSDIDLAFGVDGDINEVIEDWTAQVTAEFDGLHLLDVTVPTAIYRVFLLPGSLQVDLAFSPEDQFGPRGPKFRMIFGKAAQEVSSSSSVSEQIGLGCLYLLHAHSSLARGKLWQGNYFVAELRNISMSLACRRLGLPAAEGRGFDRLPKNELKDYYLTVPSSISNGELQHALTVSIQLFVKEAARHDPDLARELIDRSVLLRGFE
ncbi:MAG: nucleotidyltransferase domain-containing protein [Actinomycetota bacterium]